MRCYFSLNLGKDQKTSTSKNLCLILNVEFFDVDLFQFNRLGFFQKFVATTGPISEKEATSGGGENVPVFRQILGWFESPQIYQWYSLIFWRIFILLSYLFVLREVLS